MKPILLLHGALGASSQLEALQKLVQAKGRIVYSISFSGHSGEPFSADGFGIDVFAQDVLRFLDTHQLQQVDIFGYSMGGYVAIWFAHLYPERVGRILTLGTKFDWSPDSAEKEVRKMNPEKIEEKIPAFARLLESRHAPNSWKELMQRTAGMMLELGTKPLLTETVVTNIQHEVMIALGDADDMADNAYSKQVAEWLPRGRFVLLANTPHPIEKVNLLPLLPFLEVGS